jgi:hypothetical protein
VIDEYQMSEAIRNITDEQLISMTEMVKCLSSNLTGNPFYVQELIVASEAPGFAGRVAFMMLGMYAMGMIRYKSANGIMGAKSGWELIDKVSLEQDYMIN